MKKQINQNIEIIDKLKKDLTEMNKEKENLKETFFKNKCENENRFNQTLLDVQEKITLLQQDLSNTINDNKNLTKKLEESKNKAKKLQIFIDDLKNEKNDLQKIIDTLTEKNTKITDVIIIN